MAPPGLASDPSVPSAAGVYNCLIRQPGCLPASRALAAKLTDPETGHPGIRDLAVANRRFILKAAERAALDRISQILDLGCGLPASPMVHQAARVVLPEARVVYVDKDPTVTILVAAVLEQAREGLAVVEADVTDPASVLRDPALTGPEAVLDLAEPVCVLLGGTLSAMSAQEARSAVAGFADALVPGSRIVISCANFADEDLAAMLIARYARACSWRNHSPGDIASFFGGLKIAAGEVTGLRHWPATSPQRRDADLLGGIGLVR